MTLVLRSQDTQQDAKVDISTISPTELTKLEALLDEGIRKNKSESKLKQEESESNVNGIDKKTSSDSTAQLDSELPSRDEIEQLEVKLQQAEQQAKIEIEEEKARVKSLDKKLKEAQESSVTAANSEKALAESERLIKALEEAKEQSEKEIINERAKAEELQKKLAEVDQQKIDIEILVRNQAKEELKSLAEDFNQLAELARLEILAVKNRVKELEQELINVQQGKGQTQEIEPAESPTDATALQQEAVGSTGSESFQEETGQIDDDHSFEEQAELLPNETALLKQQTPGGSEGEFTQEELDLMDSDGYLDEEFKATSLRESLIDTINMLKQKLSAGLDADSVEYDQIQKQIDSVEATFERLNSIAAVELASEKKKVELLKTELARNKTEPVPGILMFNGNRSNKQKLMKPQSENNDETCTTFPNLCKHFKDK